MATAVTAASKKTQATTDRERGGFGRPFLFPLAARRSQFQSGMSKHNNVNPNFYNIGGREHTEGADKGDTHADQKALLANSKKHEAANAPQVPGARQSKKK